MAMWKQMSTCVTGLTYTTVFTQWRVPVSGNWAVMTHFDVVCFFVTWLVTKSAIDCNNPILNYTSFFHSHSSFWISTCTYLVDCIPRLNSFRTGFSLNILALLKKKRQVENTTVEWWNFSNKINKIKDCQVHISILICHLL